MKMMKQLTLSTAVVLLMGSQAFASIDTTDTTAKHSSHKAMVKMDTNTNFAVKPKVRSR